MSEKEVANWLYDKAAATLAETYTRGDMEQAIDRQSLEVRRQVLERLTQAAASREAFDCPKCNRSLNVVDHHRQRTVKSYFQECVNAAKVSALLSSRRFRHLLAEHRSSAVAVYWRTQVISAFRLVLLGRDFPLRQY